MKRMEEEKEGVFFLYQLCWSLSGGITAMQWKEPKGGGAVKWMGGRLVVSEEEGGKGESVSRLPTIFTPRSPLPAARAPHFDSSFGEEAFFPAPSQTQLLFLCLTPNNVSREKISAAEVVSPRSIVVQSLRHFRGMGWRGTPT